MPEVSRIIYHGRDIPTGVDVEGPYDYDSLPATAPADNPYLLTNGLLVCRDNDIPESPWVLSDCNCTSWSLLSYLSYTDYISGSPPSGWAETLSNGGTITVMADRIRMIGPHLTNGSAALGYTITGLAAGERIVVIGKIAMDPRGGSTTKERVQYNDQRRNGGAGEYCWCLLNQGFTDLIGFYGGVQIIPSDTDFHISVIAIDNGETAEDLTVLLQLDRTFFGACVSQLAGNHAQWRAGSAVDAVTVFADGSSGDPEDAVTDIEWLAIYKRAA